MRKKSQTKPHSSPNRDRVRVFMLAIMMVLAAGLVAAEYYIPASAQALSQLRVETTQGISELRVEVAMTPPAREKGLMFRKSLPSDSGMLFDFGLPEMPADFWMKNTSLPLDIIFINAQGKVIHVYKNATPFSEEIISSQRPVRAVLEVNAGVVDHLGIKEGSRIHHAIFEGEQKP